MKSPLCNMYESDSKNNKSFIFCINFVNFFVVVEPEPNHHRPGSMGKEPCENDFDGMAMTFFSKAFLKIDVALIFLIQLYFYQFVFWEAIKQ